METPSSNSDSSSFHRLEEIVGDDSDEQMAIAMWFQMMEIALASNTPQHGGSVKGKLPNIDRDYGRTHLHYMLKYFWPAHEMRPGTNSFGPEQPEHAFERRFRMPRISFNRILSVCITHSEYMRQGLKPDCTGKMGITPLVKVICALRILSYGIPSDLADDMFNVSETTADLCVKNFCSAVQTGLKSQYLRDPTDEELKEIEKQFAKAGFPGCIGCLDCAGWEWKNCPKALQGIMTGKNNRPEVRMEVICSLDLWIWSFKFGLPGAMNDLNILELSDHFAKVLSGVFPSISPNYQVDNKPFSWFYYLTDGIYPPWRIFIQSINNSDDEVDKHFSAAQEAVRKCIERVFGVLYRRFKILFIACEYWSVEKMRSVSETAVILHNMIVEQRRASYSSDGTAGRSSLFFNELESNDITFINSAPGETPLFSQTSVTVSDDIKVVGMHRDLKSALVQHQWKHFRW